MLKALRKTSVPASRRTQLPGRPEPAMPFSDMAILYGPSSMHRIQVFSVVTLQDAVAIARKDRDPKLIEAIKLFADLQSKLERDEKATL
jgi:hypothetical protein